MAVIAGKPSEVIGNKDSTLILRGSSVKVQWGNKFIDLIKNGKIATESEKILKVANSEEELKTDGIYLVDESVWMVLNGTKVQLTSENPTYISYFVEQQLNAEQKNTALKNIGFYYDSLEDVDIKAGLVYILGENKVYLVKDGIVSEFKSEQEINIDIPIQSLQIQDYSLVINGEQYITCNNDTITMHKQSIFEDGIYSPSATNSTGYRIYIKNGKSYLDIDYVNERNKTENINLYKTKYYQEENIVLAVTDDDNDDNDIIILTLLRSDKYKVGDILTTEIIINIPNDQGDNEPILTTVDFKISSINGNNYTVTITSEYLEIIKENIQIFKNQHIFYKHGELPITRISDHNYDLFEPQKSQLGDVTTRIGTISELITEEEPKIEPLQESLKTYLYTKEELGEELEELPKKYGIYSNNSILEYSKLILPEIFISETKKYLELSTKIGELPLNNEIIKGENSKKIEDFTEKKQGIYSDNAVLLEPKTIKSEEYCTIFKDLGVEESENKYPRYDNELEIPSTINNLLAFNQSVPNVEWIKKMMDLLIPIGTIIMFNGKSEIPLGWVECNEENSLKYPEIVPNLTNKFIKCSNITGNNINKDLNKNGKLTLKQEHLPIHSHPHVEHNHTHNSHYHSIPSQPISDIETSEIKDLKAALEETDYIWYIKENTETVEIPNVEKTEDGLILGTRHTFLTGLETYDQGGIALVDNHLHTLDLTIPENKTDPTTTTEQSTQSLEKTLTKKEYPNKEINIEPNSYSLIFIIKVQSFAII